MQQVDVKHDIGDEVYGVDSLFTSVIKGKIEEISIHRYDSQKAWFIQYTVVHNLHCKEFVHTFYSDQIYSTEEEAKEAYKQLMEDGKC